MPVRRSIIFLYKGPRADLFSERNELWDNNLLLVTPLVNAAALAAQELPRFPRPLPLGPGARSVANAKAAYAVLDLPHLLH